MKKYAFVVFLMAIFSSQSVSAASCSVSVPFASACTLWYGYGSGAKEVNAPATITLSGSPETPDKPTHFNCQPASGVNVPTTAGGWILVKNGPSHKVAFMPGAVTMPSDQYGGLASDGAAITCSEMIPRGK
ncbi:MAG: hypothetical protein WAU31_03505 [Candidatus Moraniibacteriota bacterium]